MRLFRATQNRLLLLMLALGFAALTLHVSMHTQPDQQGCELCGGHVNPTHAMAAAPQVALPTASADVTPSFTAQSWQPQTRTAFRPRAPPVLN